MQRRELMLLFVTINVVLKLLLRWCYLQISKVWAMYRLYDFV